VNDVERVFAHIDGFLSSTETSHCAALANVIGRCAGLAHRGYYERSMEDAPLLESIIDAMQRAKELGTQPPATLGECKTAFRKLAVDAMIARRSILPLDNPVPWKESLDPRAQLFDDDDQFSYAVYDTLADEISKLQPDLQNLAIEVSWDADQL